MVNDEEWLLTWHLYRTVLLLFLSWFLSFLPSFFPMFRLLLNCCCCWWWWLNWISDLYISQSQNLIIVADTQFPYRIPGFPSYHQSMSLTVEFDVYFQLFFFVCTALTWTSFPCSNLWLKGWRRLDTELDRKTPVWYAKRRWGSLVFDRKGRACVVSNRCIYFRRKRLVADIVLYSMAENCKESGSLRRCRLTEADVGSLEHRSTLVTTRTDISHRYQSMHLASVTGTLTNAC